MLIEFAVSLFRLIRPPSKAFAHSGSFPFRSPSFIFATASMAYFLLAFMYFLIDVMHWWTGVPLVFAGEFCYASQKLRPTPYKYGLIVITKKGQEEAYYGLISN